MRKREFRERRRTKNKPKTHASKKQAQGMTELALAVRRLSHLRHLQATIGNGHADFLLTQVAFLKHLTRLDLGNMRNPNKDLRKPLPKGLKELRLLYQAKPVMHKNEEGHSLDLSQ